MGTVRYKPKEKNVEKLKAFLKKNEKEIYILRKQKR